MTLEVLLVFAYDSKMALLVCTWRNPTLFRGRKWTWNNNYRLSQKAVGWIRSCDDLILAQYSDFNFV